ncbi:undecaprenyl-diphosphatase UppP [uncultured Thermanaerothrix sp.]|uniref:undecaprenyl-diphosphatase UppP n=1 Tax=uncultured Thermanaerothrix sp. TaxID=1195149 RepID=UPI00262DBD48|nr:undecaprenyl-diphosphatase UppP [uncultured Thermanaerothrix sp.]
MTITQAFVLGIIQGITEFLPISSSAHLVIVPYLLGWHFPADQVFPFDVLVQIGTLVAVILYFWADLWHILTIWVKDMLARTPFAHFESRLGWLLLLSTLPGGIGGILLKDAVESAFLRPDVTAFFLFGTALFLFTAERYGRRNRTLADLNWKDALWIGVAQVLALFPGISRSGATIAGGMTRHLERPAAGRYAFLMAIPIMLAAGGASLWDLRHVNNLEEFLPVMAVGFSTAAVVGYLSIHWLLRFISRHTLLIFAFYCIFAGGITLGIYF